MRSMVIGDQQNDDGDAGTADAPGEPGFIEIEPVQCSCKWATMDTGNAFYSRIIKPDPECPAHRR